jgi:TolA-binding protein
VYRRYLIVLLFLPVLCLATGCVYYNTFYHARAAYREAEILRETRAPGTEPGAAEKELLDRVVEKCGRVLQLHPDSEWADDALLLLGMTHYYQQRYESAEARLKEFIARYPGSELLPEAQYMLASVLLERGNAVSAENYLEPIAEASPPNDLSDDALALIGRARHERKKYQEAAEAYEEALERFPNGDRRAEIRFHSAQNYEDMGDLDAAARQYGLVPSERSSRKLVLEARMRLAQVDLGRGRTDQALEVLAELERRTEDRDELDRILLMRGDALAAGGDVEDAIATYAGISASHGRSDASAEAYYRTGLLYRDRYEQLDEAVASFRKAKEESPRSDAAELAGKAMGDVDKLRGYLETIARGEDAGGKEAGEEASGVTEGAPATGSHGTTDAGEPFVEPVEAAPGDAVAPGGVIADTSAHVTLLPGSSGASPVREATVDSLGGAGGVQEGATLDSLAVAAGAPEAATADSVAVKRSDPVATARFRAAELYLFRFDDVERARKYYSSVLTNHPDDPLAPKAALALAWILETRLGDESGARAAYWSIVADYPDSDFSEAAEEALARLEGTDAGRGRRGSSEGD